MAKSTDELLKEKLGELFAKRDALQAAVLPHREAINAAQEAIQKIRDGIASDVAAVKAANQTLAPIENEISKLARATGGKVMSEG